MTMPSSERQPSRRDQHLTDAELNELVDGSLAAGELARVQAHLGLCAECDERYQTLLATVSALKQTPSVMPRRSFQLTLDQAKLPEKKLGRFDRFAERILPGVPAIKTATIAVALLLISITAFDVLTNQSGQDDGSPSTSMQRESDAPAAEVDVAQPAATEAPTLGEANESFADTGEADTAIVEAETGGSGAEAEPADGAFSSAAEAPAPAAAIEQPAIAASPTSEPTVTPTPEPTRTVTPTPTPAPGSDGWRAGVDLSWWRIAELGLLMVLVWLVVSWIGRARVGNLDD